MDKLNSYDYYIVFFSGGKDSLATVLWLLSMGVPAAKIELWHHLVDGREGPTLFDWECTEDYCRKVAEHLGVPIYFSWLEGGFFREMMRQNQPKARTWFETPSNQDGLMSAGGSSNKVSTRLMFPQVSGQLSVRWCSAYLKIDVARIALRNDPRFKGKRVLVLSGERAQESSGRSKYLPFEPETVGDRTVHHLRPIHRWQEQQVWQIIKDYHIIVHPCYYLGFSRCSCKFCIFGNADQFASAAFISMVQASHLIRLEQQFGKTLKRDKDLFTLIASGTVYEQTIKLDHFREQATSTHYYLPITTDHWVLPAGAYGSGCGPT